MVTQVRNQVEKEKKDRIESQESLLEVMERACSQIASGNNQNDLERDDEEVMKQQETGKHEEAI